VAPKINSDERDEVQKWIWSTVVISIRKTGGFSDPWHRPLSI